MQGDGKINVDTKSVGYEAEITPSRSYTNRHNHVHRTEGNKFRFKDEIDLRTILRKEEGQKKPNAVLVLDFDLTIVNGHMHSHLNKMWQSGRLQKENGATETLVTEFLEKTGSFRNEELLQKVIEESLNNNNIAVAVASHSSYPEGIKIAMNKLLGSELADKVSIVTCDNVDMQSCHVKEPLVKEIAEFYGITEKSKIVLVDDTEGNVDNIIGKGYQGIHAKKGNNKYLDDINVFVTSVKEATRYENLAEGTEQGKKEPIYENLPGGTEQGKKEPIYENLPGGTEQGKKEPVYENLPRGTEQGKKEPVYENLAEVNKQVQGVQQRTDFTGAGSDYAEGHKDRDHNSSSASASNDQNNIPPKKESLWSSIVATIKQFFIAVLNSLGLGSFISNNKADAKDSHNNPENVNEAGHGKARSAEQSAPLPDSRQHVNGRKHSAEPSPTKPSSVDIRESIVSNLDDKVFPKGGNERKDAISAIKASVIEMGRANNLTLTAKKGSLNLKSQGMITDESRTWLQNVAEEMAKTLSEARLNDNKLSTKDQFMHALQESFGPSNTQSSEKSPKNQNEFFSGNAARLQFEVVANEINDLNSSGAKIHGAGAVDPNSNVNPPSTAADKQAEASSAAKSR